MSQYKITAKDVEEYFQKINYTLKPGDIVFLRTDADDRWGKPEYLVAGAGMSYEATMWLLERGVRVVGTDGWSWRPPCPLSAPGLCQLQQNAEAAGALARDQPAERLQLHHFFRPGGGHRDLFFRLEGMLPAGLGQFRARSDQNNGNRHPV